MEYRVQQKASVWVEVSVEARSLKKALELAEEEISSGNFEEDPTSFELEDEYWWENDKGESGTV
jgi:hypothetical protein